MLILGNVYRPYKLNGFKLEVAAILYDIYMFRRAGVANEAPVNEKYGGFEMATMNELGKRLDVSITVKITN